LRVSVAEIESDGPFSEFEGIDRWFAVLRGEGVTLRWPSRERSLGPESGPVSFDGAQAPDCSLHSGATTDLNLMCRRSAGQGQMLRTPSHPVWQSSAPWRALFTVCAATLEINGEWAAELAPMSLLVSRSAVGETWALRAPEPPQSFWLAFTPNSRA
jgi:environmental stress-induced protein Ves